MPRSDTALWNWNIAKKFLGRFSNIFNGEYLIFRSTFQGSKGYASPHPGVVLAALKKLAQTEASTCVSPQNAEDPPPFLNNRPLYAKIFGMLTWTTCVVNAPGSWAACWESTLLLEFPVAWLEYANQAPRGDFWTDFKELSSGLMRVITQFHTFGLPCPWCYIPPTVEHRTSVWRSDDFSGLSGPWPKRWGQTATGPVKLRRCFFAVGETGVVHMSNEQRAALCCEGHTI